MEIQTLIKHANRLCLVTLETPFNKGFQKVVIWGFRSILIAQFSQEFKLADGIIVLLLLDPAVDHAIEWVQVRVIECCGSLICLVCLIKVA